MKKVIPIQLNSNPIPKGAYCYTNIETPSETNGYSYLVEKCPFWSKTKENVEKYGDQMSGYCAYLNEGDWMDNAGGLLWDQVKSCGENDYDEEDLDLY